MAAFHVYIFGGGGNAQPLAQTLPARGPVPGALPLRPFDPGSGLACAKRKIPPAIPLHDITCTYVNAIEREKGVVRVEKIDVTFSSSVLCA